MDLGDDRLAALRGEWTDQFVEVVPDRPEWARFRGILGRVTTVNCNGLALVDFQDGGWYDVPLAHLVKQDAATARSRFDFQANSAQTYPARQS